MDKNQDIETQTKVDEEFVKELSLQDFLNVGLDQIAYIRRVVSQDIASVDEQHDYIVYGADGSQISVMNSYDTALAAVRINDLFPVTLH